MSRRHVATAVAAAVVSAGIIPLGLSLASAAGAPCAGWTDPAKDGGPSAQGFSAQAGVSDDPALDLVAVTVGNTATDLVVSYKVSNLGGANVNPAGDRYALYWTANGHANQLYAIRDITTLYNNSVKLTDRTTTVTGTAAYDTAHNVVTVTVKLADYKTVIGADPLSTPMTAFSAEAWNETGPQGVVWDIAAPAAATYAFTPVAGGCTGGAPVPSGSGSPTSTGSPSASATPTATPTGSASPTPTASASSSPAPSGQPLPRAPESAIVNTGKTTSQYGDVAVVSAKLTDARNGAALSGKPVVFKLAGKSATATTNSSGIATARLAITATASSQTLVEAFAGDSSFPKSSASTKYTVAVEKTKITLAVAKSGNNRTVTASLLDDDNHALAKQKVVVYINGAKKTTLTTDSKGHAVYKAAKGQTVKFTFAAVSGKYAAASVQSKLA